MRGDQLLWFGEHRGRGNCGRAFVECLRQGGVAIVAAAVDEQQIDCDGAGPEPCNRVDDCGEIGAR